MAYRSGTDKNNTGQTESTTELLKDSRAMMFQQSSTVFTNELMVTRLQTQLQSLLYSSHGGHCESMMRKTIFPYLRISQVWYLSSVQRPS